MAIQRDDVVQTALALLDGGGMEGVTLRKVAQALDIQAPSLYWHFANKQALLDAMADAMLQDVARDVSPDADWRAVLDAVSLEIRHAFNAYRDGARVFAGTYETTENVLRTGEAMIAAFVRAGADIELATTTAFSVVYYVVGFVIEEQAFNAEASSEKAAESVARKTAFLNAAKQTYPLSWQARQHLFAPDFDKRFSVGIDLLLSGFAQQLADGNKKKAPRRSHAG
ncbi:TetR family transcriptional regulator [Pandoraea iniqua]|uniref:TetR/AcrR family transcriptional regulator C-terminal domain-containing protein n=1 Tax=Pandoraea iniqua TaxID=2508288 RepID=UPI001242B743|nr:TetR/AcrR family transcriptional regulator C-terminal domain-containing protein [Pandoraea iniqua]VVE27456.1 TetR family transcriptional regulator [Pandoraea iniqua]